MINQKALTHQGIVVFVETDGEQLHPVSLEMLGVGKDLLQEGEELIGVLVGHNLNKTVEQLKAYAFDLLIVFDHWDFRVFAQDLYAKCMIQVIESMKTSVFLAGGTAKGRALSPLVSAYFATGLTADCTALKRDKLGNLLQIRPAYGGNVMAEIVTRDRRPQCATVRPGIMDGLTKSIHSRLVIHHEQLEKKLQSQLLDLKNQRVEKKDHMEDASIIVAAGRGFKRKEDLKLVFDYAEMIGASVGSSRGLVEKGWMDPSRQIGLSGRSVAPELLITFGVSGSVQFQAGIQKAKKIIAIDNDEHASIFHIAHEPICADLYGVLEKLMEKGNYFE